MAKPVQRLKARSLRREKGLSIKEIAEKVGVSKSTVSLLCRDIELTPSQIKQLEERQKNAWLRSRIKGQLKGAWLQKQRRLKKIKKFQKQAEKEIKQLNKKELFLTGVALYWAEGQKKRRTVGLTSSDPKMILFFIKWLQEICRIPKNRLKCFVGINEAHRERIEEVENYWSRLTGIPKSQFTKTSLKKVKNKKKYENFNNHYGTLSVRLARPANPHYRVMGWVHALRNQAA